MVAATPMPESTNSTGGPPPEMLEARSIGAADQNETIPEAQRDPVGNCPKTDGPVRHASGAYMPAEYTRERLIPGSEGKLVKVTVTRRDR